MSIVETMARAMRGIIWGHDWDGLSDPCRDLYREEIRAALRAIKPEDVSDGMVEAYRQALYAERASDRTMTAGAERRAIAAAIAAGAEQ